MSQDITLSAQQNSIVRNFTNGNANMIVHGGAGTGKSTLIKTIADALGDKVASYSPTYASASVLMAKGIENVKQVKSLRHESQLRSLAESSVTHIVVDESSMCDREDMSFIQNIVCAASRKMCVMFIGDPRQLPPISNLPEFFIPDWFAVSNPDAVLHDQYRRTEAIIPKVIETVGSVASYDAIITMTNEARGRMNARAHIERYGEDAFIRAAYRSRSGKKVLRPRVGQELICYETDKNQTYLNNVAYKIRSVFVESDCFKVTFEGKRVAVKIPHSDFELDTVQSGSKSRWSFSYALTGHSAQGREFDKTLVLIESEYNGQVTTYGCNKGIIHRWLYTALTRGKKVIHVYDPENAIEHDNLSLDITPEDFSEASNIIQFAA